MLNINIRVTSEQARAALRSTEAQLKALQKTVGTSNGVANKAAGSWGGFFNSFSPERMRKSGKEMQWVGRQLTMNFTLPLVAAGAASTKWALDNERAMTSVRKVYGDGTESTKQLNRELVILDKTFLALSNRFGIARSEVAKIGAAWAQAGAAGVGLQRATELTLKTMIVGEMDATQATEGLIAIQGAYRLDTQQLVKTMHSLNAIENQTAIKTSGLIDAITRAGGTARNAGIDIRHLSAMAATLVPSAGSAAQAGNSLRTMISRIQAPTKDAIAELESMGIAVDSVAWQSANTMKKIEILSGAFDGLSDSQKAAASAAVASRWQINRFDLLMESVNDRVKNGSKSTFAYSRALNATANETKALNTYNKELLMFMQSDPQQLKIMTNALKNTMAEAIQPLIPVLIILMNHLAQLGQAFAGLSPEMQQIVLIGLAMLAMVGPVSQYIGAWKLLIGDLTGAISFLGSKAIAAFSGIGRVGADLLAKMTTWPYAISGAWSTGAGKVSSTWTTASGRVSKVWQRAMVQMRAAQTAAMTYLRSAPLILSAIWQGVTLRMQKAWAAAQVRISAMWAATMARLSVISAGFMPFLRSIPLMISAAWQGATFRITRAWIAMQIRLGAISAKAAVFISNIPWLIAGVWLTVTTFISNVWAKLQLRMLAMSGGFGLTWAGITFAMGTSWAAFSAFVASSWAAVSTFVIARAAAMWVAVTGPIGIAVTLIAAALLIIAATIDRFYKGGIGKFFGDIGRGLGQLPRLFADAFHAVLRVVAAIMRRIIDWLSYLNPFARHSPSLVDNVTAGVGVILSQYKRLGGISGILGGAKNALADFQNQTATQRDSTANGAIAKQRADVVAAAPGAGGAFDSVLASIRELRPALRAVGDEVDRQENVTAKWENAVKAANKTLDAQEAILKNLTNAADALKNQLDAATDILNDLADTPLTGMRAMEDAIFGNEMAQKRLRLEMMKLDADGNIQTTVDQLAKLQGAIEGLQSEATDLRSSGAGSDVLGPLNAQLAEMDAAKRALQSGAASSPIGQMQRELETLERQSQMMDLEKSLAFDPLTRQIEQASTTLREMPFDQVISQITSQKAVVDQLTSAWQTADAAVTAQTAVVDQTKASRDELVMVYDREKSKLDELKDAYAAIEQQISASESALNDFASSAAAARTAAKEAADAAGAGGGAGYDFADVGGSGAAGREGDIGDMEAFLKQAEADAAKTLKGMKFDMLAPFKNGWKAVKRWLGDRWNDLFGLMAGGFLWVADRLRPVVEPTFGFLQTIFSGIWNAIGAVVEFVWNNILSPIFRVMSGFFTGVLVPAISMLGQVFGFVFNLLGTVLGAVWAVAAPIFQAIFDFINTYIIPVFQLFGAIIEIVAVLIGRLIMWVWDNVLSPVFNWIVDLITGDVAPTVSFLGEVFRVVFDAIAGVAGWLWNTILKPILGALWWFISNVLAPVFTWLWRTIIEPAFQGIAAIGGWLWNTILKPVFDSLVAFFKNTLAPIFGWIWHEIIEPAFNGIATFVGAVWGGITDTIRNAVNLFIDAFNWIVRGVKRVAEFLSIDVSINEIPRLEDPNAPRGSGRAPRVMHTGGLVDERAGVGRSGVSRRQDEIDTVLQRGEYVLSREQVKRMSEIGGPMDFIKDTAGKAGRGIKSGGKFVGEQAVKAAKEVRSGTVTAVFAPFLKSIDAALNVIPVKFIKQTGEKIKNDVYNWVKGEDTKAAKKAAEAGQAGNAKIGGSGWQQIAAWLTLNSDVPYRITSTFRPGDKGYHGKGRAVDLAGKRPGDAAAMLNIYKALLPAAKSLKELIYYGAGGGGWKNGAAHQYNAAVVADHKDHVHAALRRGGIVLARQGGTLVRAGEGGQDEAVIPLPRGMKDMGNKTINFNGDLSFPNVKNGDDAKAFLENLESLVESNS